MLEELWVTDNGQPPLSRNYDIFLPIYTYEKWVTYIRKDLDLHPRINAKYEDCILAIAVSIDNRSTEFINIYD